MQTRIQNTLKLMAQIQILIKKVAWTSDLVFPAYMWLGSRIIIWIAMFLVAPLLPAPSDGYPAEFSWTVFDIWDGRWYKEIVTEGYKFVDDGKQHNLAFFPMLPLSIRLLMYIGLPYHLAGFLVNNLAFLAAIYCLHLWVKEEYGSDAAKWVTAAISWCPMSLFGTVIYTEGLYLLFSTGALRAFDQKQYGWTAFWGAMATATRPTGLALIPAFLVTAWKERRKPKAYFAAFATAMGVLCISIYCLFNFDNPLAFIRAQRGWRPSLGFDFQGWWNMVAQFVVGITNWQYGWIKEPLHPLLFVLVIGSAYALYRFHKNVDVAKYVYGLYGLIAIFMVIANDSFINNLLNILMFFGGSYLLWYLRSELTTVTVIYGFCGIALLLASGGTMSLSRISYGIVPLILAVGVSLSSYKRQGYLILGIFAILLFRLSVKFAQYVWVG